ncbi:MAG: protein-glutamate O-methyltransferase CheR [Proteobacteria bacterium]|nr:protein-glutamate O-methyltransferase CheR [Pseudomonadota bacterium]
MTGAEFDHFCQAVKARSGLSLTAEKGYLVRSRLAPVARSEGLADVPALLAKLKAGAPEELMQRCVDAMATHESYFFRDGTPFEQLAQVVVPELVAARPAARSLRIWCAAASSGQEPYSVAMVLQELGGLLAGWRTEIVATDMSAPILRKARDGIYSDFEVRRGLSPERLGRWFSKVGEAWQVSPALKQMITFRPHNLLQGVAGLGTFDIILCRNVLIYFEVERKREILAQLATALAPDGRLFLGSAETVLGVSSVFEAAPEARGLYRRSQAPAAKIA